MNYSSISVAAFAAILLSAAAPQDASAAEPYFKGKDVTVVVPSGSGGTYHVYCQLVQRNLGRHLPGNPDMLIQNRPGSGGVKAANYVSNVAPKDGSTIAMISPGSVIMPLIRRGHSAIRFDTRKLNWLGSASVRTYTVGFWYETGIDSIEDLRTRATPAIMVTTGKAATSYLIPSFMNYTMGTKMKIITGYKSGGSLNMAIERGEGQGRGNFYSGYTGVRPEWIRDHKINFVATMGPPHPALKGVPSIRDFMDTELEKEMYDLLDVNFQVGQAFYAPPGTPKKVVDILRKAFAEMQHDPETIADAKKRRVPWYTRTWQQNEAAVAKGFEASPEAVEKLAEVLGFGNHS